MACCPETLVSGWNSPAPGDATAGHLADYRVDVYAELRS